MKEFDMAQAKLAVFLKWETEEAQNIEGTRYLNVEIPVTDKAECVASYVENHGNSVLPNSTIHDVPVTIELGNIGENYRNSAFSNVPPTQVVAHASANENSFKQVRNSSVRSSSHPQPDELEGVVKLLIEQEQVNLNRLPPPEPGMFYGSPLTYAGWRCAFNTLICQKGISPSENLLSQKISQWTSERGGRKIPPLIN